MSRLFRTYLVPMLMTALCLGGLLASPGCSQLTGTTIPAATASGPESNVGKALAAVTTARNLLTAAVNANKVSAADATNLRAQINTARDGIDVAEKLFTTDGPAAGQSRLDIANKTLDGIRAYLTSKGT